MPKVIVFLKNGEAQDAVADADGIEVIVVEEEPHPAMQLFEVLGWRHGIYAKSWAGLAEVKRKRLGEFLQDMWASLEHPTANMTRWVEEFRESIRK